MNKDKCASESSVSPGRKVSLDLSVDPDLSPGMHQQALNLKLGLTHERELPYLAIEMAWWALDALSDWVFLHQVILKFCKKHKFYHQRLSDTPNTELIAWTEQLEKMYERCHAVGSAVMFLRQFEIDSRPNREARKYVVLDFDFEALDLAGLYFEKDLLSIWNPPPPYEPPSVEEIFGDDDEP